LDRRNVADGIWRASSKVKYWLASLLSLLATLSLITLSCWLLKMTWDRIAFFGAVITVMTFALNGLAVGLGVLYPNLKEANPEQNRQRFRRHAVPRLEFALHSRVHRAARFRHDGTAPRTQVGRLKASSDLCCCRFLIGWLPLKFGLRQRLKNFEA
jgi:hypothetical protein